MKNLILTLIFTLPLTLWGQGWEQTFGDSLYNSGQYIQQTSDGGYILTGGINSTNSDEIGDDIIILKTDINGDEVWRKTYGGIYRDIGYDVKNSIDGGFIICGNTNGSPDTSEIIVIKTDQEGNEIWTKTFGINGYNNGYSIDLTNDGGYIITGSTGSFGYGSSDVYLIKTDENGNELWFNTFGGSSGDVGNSVQQTSDGGYIITGSTGSFGNGLEDVWLIKTDGNGQEQWNQTFGGIEVDMGYSVQQTDDGGYIITGRTRSFGNGLEDVWLIKTDGNGQEQWNQTFGGINKDIGSYISITDDNGFIICGYTKSFDNPYGDIFIIKTNDSGDEVWNQTFGEFGFYKECNCIQQTDNDEFILVGTKQFTKFDKLDNISHIYLIKTNQFGNITSTFEIPLPNPNRKLEKTVNLIGQEIKPQTNTPIIELFDDGSTQKKIIIE